MRVVKASTALGKRLLETGQQWQGTFLNQVYGKWSHEKRTSMEQMLLGIL